MPVTDIGFSRWDGTRCTSYEDVMLHTHASYVQYVGFGRQPSSHLS